MTPKGRNPQATFVWIGDSDRVCVLNSDGDLILARFTPQGYVEDSRANVLGPTWANPAFADGAVFARNDSTIARIQLAESPAARSAAVDDARRIDLLLREWEKQTRDVRTLRVQFERKTFDKAAPQAKPERGILQAAGPSAMRVDWLGDDSQPTGNAVWIDGEFRYYDHSRRRMTLMKRPDRLKSFGDRLAAVMTGVPERFSFLWTGLPPEKLRERFDVRYVEEDGGAVWLGLQPRLTSDKVGFEHLLVGLDKVTGRPGYVAFVTSEQKQELVTVKSFAPNPSPSITRETLLSNLPTDFESGGPLP